MAGPLPGQHNWLVAGTKQGPSGTPYDPAVQFAVERVESESPLRVVGRCWFGPIRVDTEFTAVGRKRDSGSWDRHDIKPVVVAEIAVFDRPVEAIDQAWSALLTFTQFVELRHLDVLIATSGPDQSWARDGELWVLDAAE